MTRKIRRAAVLGSGVMGAGIAAHLANVGIPVLMLDIAPKDVTDKEKKQGLTMEDRQVRNRVAMSGKEGLKKQKPAPLTSKENLHLIEAGNMTDDMDKLSEVDWIIEVVVENLDIKKSVFREVDKYRKAGSIVSSNTSGISIEAMSEDCSEDMKKHFLGTHFFNPPRYLKLLEVIPTSSTDKDVLEFMKKFGEDTLGKGVVEAKDTPNFIANRIGTYGLLVTVREMLEQNLSVGEVDSVTGPMIGRPKSATFRTLDVVGLDTFIHVANNVHDQVKGQEKEVFKVPEFMQDMNEKGWIGQKAGQGFFLKKKSEEGSEILQLNPETMEYEKRGKLKTKAVEAAGQEKGPKRKLASLVKAKGDQAGDFVWSIVKPVLLYSAELTGEIADDLVSIDEAMRWGFGWDLGPFEMWDAIGVQKSVERMKEEGETVPEWIDDMLKNGNESFYKKENGNVYYYHKGDYKQQGFNAKDINLRLLKETKEVLAKNAGASVIDLGDGVAGLEFHSQSNAIGMDVIQMINKAVDIVDEDFEGLVIGNQGNNFCVGANLGMMLMEAQDQNFFEIELVVKQFQQAMMRIKYSDKPVVAAPFGMALGGGAEVCLPAAAIQASSETYMGLVEPGVGLIPGGGGNKELYLKHLNNMPESVDFDLQKVSNSVFQKIATAKTSTSAEEARQNGFLDQMDAISFNQDHLLHDAKQKVLGLARAGYQAPKRKPVPVTGESGFATMLLGAKEMHYGGFASDHDLKIAEKLAFVLAGGRVKEGSKVDEQYLLDLEREAFLSLIGEAKTQQRMQHMLLKGKPLRN
ncbi:3-hydroxyacyl-CoA dehydrogenase [Salimicrobium jeotgali]|uniref:3-hydroxyacyl-CoA dehydrogenase n=1 Tax=Salimicrobium jeotgali TaxID=1230341 RepID=K2GFU7_9BACI|nr:3-hydroxyacyl-CoA dehydrogenase/enoyl-CoA hydratase family protein [Salimicrobium jeotgali]AKG03966.1 3-hydroxyacyl-CoA dehydrogenase [Salimicrobium jeotgali]EKE33002.1 3-hydroxyacyl-CoA dehydrogenase [Salimicrobium jeotgali]MBM7695003.1 3-hydroxyacyl-CoA dehydrogenase [Salimicrobium jeotgali]